MTTAVDGTEPTVDEQRTGETFSNGAVSTAWVYFMSLPRVRPVSSLIRRWPAPRLLLGAAIVAWVTTFVIHVIWRQNRFGTFDLDLGIWDQSVWLLANGESFNTVRGLEVFGFHSSYALYLLVPFYWLGAGPNFLNVIMVLSLALGAVAIFWAGRHHLSNEWFALVIALAFLVNYAGQWMMQETFHPEVMAVTPILFAYVAFLKKRWWLYAGLLVYAGAWKEDVALAVFMLGFLVLVRGQRRAGAVTMVAALGWFLLATQVLIPAYSPAGNFTEGLFGDLGSSPTEIVATSVSDPSIPIEHLNNADAPGYVFDLAASFGFVGLLSPLALLIGLPQFLINTLAIYDFFWTTKVHYAALPLAAMGIAAVEGVARFRRVSMRRFLVGALAVGAFYTAISWGVAPYTPDYDQGFWPLYPIERQDVLDAAAAYPDADDRVAASYNLVPHLTHRSNIYTFPNPWRLQNWGVAGEGAPDPNDVDVLIVDLNITDAETLVLVDEILAGNLGSEWEVVSEINGLLIARRVEA